MVGIGCELKTVDREPKYVKVDYDTLLVDPEVYQAACCICTDMAFNKDRLISAEDGSLSPSGALL